MTETQEWVAHLGCQKLGNRVAPLHILRQVRVFVTGIPYQGGGLVVLKLAHSWAGTSVRWHFSFPCLSRIASKRWMSRPLELVTGMVWWKMREFKKSMGTDHLLELLWCSLGVWWKYETCEEQTQTKKWSPRHGMSFPLAHQRRSKNPIRRFTNVYKIVQVLLVTL